MGADVGNPSDLLKNGATIGFGNSSASSNTTNTPMNHDSNNTLPYIQTNCGSGVGLPCLIDPAFLWKMFLELREPFAREFIKKVKEKLPDSTIEPITVKSDIYKKILLVIQAHLQHENGQAMLKKHIETQFKENMTWDNYGIYGWHIDHIVPLCSANNETELLKLFHYTNLQPLWCDENLRKNGKILI